MGTSAINHEILTAGDSPWPELNKSSAIIAAMVGMVSTGFLGSVWLIEPAAIRWAQTTAASPAPPTQAHQEGEESPQEGKPQEASPSTPSTSEAQQTETLQEAITLPPLPAVRPEKGGKTPKTTTSSAVTATAPASQAASQAAPQVTPTAPIAKAGADEEMDTRQCGRIFGRGVLTEAEAGLREITVNRAVMRGCTVTPGMVLPTGEMVVSIDPANRLIVTSKRSLWITQE